MSIVKGIAKGAAIVATSVVCPPAAGVLFLANVTHKVGKAVMDENEENAGKHVASVLGSFAAGVIDIDVDVDSD